MGKVPFVASFSCFLLARGYDQIRISIGYNQANVKLAGGHSGLITGPDGATAQVLEDIALMRVLPGMTVLVPADALEARKATIAAAGLPGPAYIRLGRAPVPQVTREEAPFVVGRANVLREGGDVALVACGVMVSAALEAARALSEEGIQAAVANLHTVKPLDGESLLRLARRTGAVVTAEEHQVNGGMGGAVAELLSREHPVPVEMVAVQDAYGESGEAGDLLEKYGLTWRQVYQKAKRVMERKAEA